MAIVILRCVFLFVASGIGISFIYTLREEPIESPWGIMLLLAGTVGLALGVIALDLSVRRKRLDTISAIYFGIVVGLALTYVVALALTLLLPPDAQSQRQPILIVMGMVLCYTCISLLLQTRNDFRFIIPYVEFSKEVKGLKPYLLDTSVVIDGRIADVAESKVFDSHLLMPRFVLRELQAIADSSDRLRRGRGRRGLDILNRLRNSDDVELKVFDREPPDLEGQPVDIKLVMLAKHLDGKVVTNDYNLNKIARIHGVDVINLNDLANALKPVFLPGEMIEVRILKPGEEEGQGVGYLDDGTMVVVEGGREHLNAMVKIQVTSVLQTSAGRMVFGRFERALGSPQPRQKSKSPGL